MSNISIDIIKLHIYIYVNVCVYTQKNTVHIMQFNNFDCLLSLIRSFFYIGVILHMCYPDVLISVPA